MPTATRRPKMTVLSNSAHGTTYRTRYTRDELNRMRSAASISSSP